MYESCDTPLFHIKHGPLEAPHLAFSDQTTWICVQNQCDGEHHYYTSVTQTKEIVA